MRRYRPWDITSDISRTPRVRSVGGTPGRQRDGVSSAGKSLCGVAAPGWSLIVSGGVWWPVESPGRALGTTGVAACRFHWESGSCIGEMGSTSLSSERWLSRAETLPTTSLNWEHCSLNTHTTNPWSMLTLEEEQISFFCSRKEEFFKIIFKLFWKLIWIILNKCILTL